MKISWSMWKSGNFKEWKHATVHVTHFPQPEQIGNRFWNKVIKEHAMHNKNAMFDESFATFFKNLDKR